MVISVTLPPSLAKLSFILVYHFSKTIFVLEFSISVITLSYKPLAIRGWALSMIASTSAIPSNTSHKIHLWEWLVILILVQQQKIWFYFNQWYILLKKIKTWALTKVNFSQLCKNEWLGEGERIRSFQIAIVYFKLSLDYLEFIIFKASMVQVNKINIIRLIFHRLHRRI